MIKYYQLNQDVYQATVATGKHVDPSTATEHCVVELRQGTRIIIGIVPNEHVGSKREVWSLYFPDLDMTGSDRASKVIHLVEPLLCNSVRIWEEVNEL